MKILSCPTPSGSTIFCDEVRFEANGKQIYIGIYTEEMLLPVQFPTRLRSLTAVIQFFERPRESRDDLKFVVTYTGIENPIAELVASRSDLDTFPIPSEDPSDPDPYDPIMRVNAVLAMNDLTLPGPGKFKVKAVRGEDAFRIGGLKVSHMPQEPGPPFPFYDLQNPKQS